ncbi:DUF3667 domain-containing protein [Roseateles sp. UC29_93]|uniref:DUF3667 domain-containing protein n=1 Tax=Roseateles sp. UC29_93 TaxID=3350177 RepID=UPI0036701A2C
MSIQVEAAGEMLVGAAVAQEIAGGSGAGAEADASRHAHGACANCTAPLQGAFCHRCGQAAHVHRSLAHLAEEFLHGILHFETKAWRTVPMLLLRPGKLTREYIDGRRVRYVSPLALLLFLLFLMFLVFSLTSPTVTLGGNLNPEQMAKLNQTLEASRAKLGELEAQLAALPAGDTSRRRVESAIAEQREEVAGIEQAQLFLDPQQAAKDPEAARAAAQQVRASLARYLPWLSAPGIEGRIDRALSQAQGPMLQIEGTSGMPVFERKLKHALENKELALYKIKGAAAKFAFLLMPISLPFLWLLLVTRRRFGMFDHAVFSLYSLSAMALLMSAVAICGYFGFAGVAVLLATVVPPLHMFAQLRGTYALGIGAAAWRTVALLFIAGGSILIYSLMIVLASM